ncbi:MAG: nucleotidyltransferase family protein [Alphaproteobacteria bacterium]|nr:nucleotidyltransferase family protein [Alphaproteobacteria bacterium]
MFLTQLPSRTASVPRNAIILAAGRGTRMLPLTERIPKPLLVIAGKTVLGRSVEHSRAAGVERIVVNASHLGEKIVEFVDGLKDDRVVCSREDEPLETGGGVVKALPLLGSEPFYVINGDSVWVDGMKSPLLRLAEGWDPERMDALLMLMPLARVSNFHGRGDFTMDQDGRLERREEVAIAPYAYMGLSIINPALLEGAPAGAFSLNWLYDRAIEAGRLFGVQHDGLWYHISTPDDLEVARDRFANGHAPAVPFF